MTAPIAVSHDPRSIPLRRRIRVRLAVALARLLAARSPRHIRTVLTRLHRRTRPATVAEARDARQAVVAVSLACAAPEGCLVRSLATVLLCRSYGYWATWGLGARRLAPFAAHAWVEIDGVMIDENYPADYFRPFFTVP
jgi:hypothetical protein